MENEDEVDWSDSSLQSLQKPRIDSQSFGQDERSPRPPSISITFEPDQCEQYDLPAGEPLSSDPSKAPRPPRFGVTRSQRARIGVHFNRRQPTTEDYSHFALYQASQKTYEAVFLKSFLKHALHPCQIRACFEDSDDTEHLERYLQSVITNVNQITRKMIWNAHSRAVNLLANDEKDTAYFWDFQRFNKHIFSNFTPENPVLVVHKLEQSWHRVEESPPMIRFSTKDYPVGKNASPLEEIDEVAETLFSHRELDNNLSTGRVVKPPKKKSKTSGLRAAALREEKHEHSHNGWLSNFPNPSILKAKELEHIHSTASDQSNGHPRHSGTMEEILWAPLEQLVDHDVHSPADSDNTSVESQGRLSPKKASISKSFRGSNDSSIISHRAVVSASKGLAKGTGLGVSDRGLTIRRFLPQKDSDDTHPTIDSAIEVAVAQGILKPPLADVLESIQIVAHMQRIKRKKLARSETDNAAATTINARAKMPRKRKWPNHHGNIVSRGASPELNDPRENKKYKTGASIKSATVNKPTPKNRSGGTSSTYSHLALDPTHPSGSKTLEQHQTLPEKAYFEPKFPNEEYAWLCSCKHAMGNYYLSGDRKYCPGCNSNLGHMPRVRRMDFYLPPKTYHCQPAPGKIWKPHRVSDKEIKSKYLSHNSIARTAFWKASSTGATDEMARKSAIKAVEEHLRSKRKDKPKPQLPVSKPEVKLGDLGPHPSGSKMLEHGQDLPHGSYWKAGEPGESRAWRCQVNHALGRYYLAGNKKACPGCGSSRVGRGRHEEMDFYLPHDTVIQQEAPGLNDWKPRRPYKIKKNPEKKYTAQTHNQICSKKYWDAVDDGRNHEDAMSLAIKKTLIEVERSARIGAAATRTKGTTSLPDRSSDSEQETHALEDMSASPWIANQAVMTEEVAVDNGIKRTGKLRDERANSGIDEENGQPGEFDRYHQTTGAGVILSDDDSMSNSDSE